jgi:hypothetical protein
LIAVAALGPNKQFPQQQASQVWGIIHGTSILLATVAVLLGFAAGLLYLEQDWRLKSKRRPWTSVRLPSLEWLQLTNTRSLAISLVMMSLGLISGMILNRIPHGSQNTALSWNDPVVLGTWAMFLWLVLQALFAAIYRPSRQGRKVAYMTLASFGFLVLALVMAMLPQTKHGGGKEGLGMSDRGGRRDWGLDKVAGTLRVPSAAWLRRERQQPESLSGLDPATVNRSVWRYCGRHTECACYFRSTP